MKQVSKQISGLANELAHGAALKGLALLARALFLIYVAPRLVVGELAHYVFLSSVAAIASRALLFGLEEQLPLVIAGSKARATKFLGFSQSLLSLQIVLVAGALVTGSDIVAAALLASCYVTTSYLAGGLRTVRVEGAERLRDLHWVVFVALALLPVAWSAQQLLLLICASLMSVQLTEVRLNRLQGMVSSVRFSAIVVELAGTIKGSWRKLLAGITILALVRGIILWPKSLTIDVMLDDIAYALMLGEAFWQTAMVIVYRRYATYCNLGSSASADIQRDCRRVIFGILGYTALAALAVYAIGLAGVVIGEFSEWVTAATMVCFFGGMASYILIRYAIWVVKDFDWLLLALELFLLALQVVTVLMLPVSVWPLAFAVQIWFLAALVLAREYLTKQFRAHFSAPIDHKGRNL